LFHKKVFMRRGTIFSVGAVCFLLVTCNNVFYTIARSANEDRSSAGEYIVRFNKNGGNTEAEPRSIIVTSPADTIAALPNVEPKQEGFIFIGWNTKADGTGDNFFANTVVTKNMTVYAKWLHLPTGSLIVHFDQNNTDENSQEAHTQNKVVIPGTSSIDALPIEPVRIGHDFTGWNTKADGTGDGFFSNTVVTKNMTVYAQWNPYRCIVTFEKNHNDEGSFTEADPRTITVVYPATTVGELPYTNPTRNHYNFIGWNDESGNAFTEDTPVGILDNKTISVYAQWAEKTYTISGTISLSDGGNASGATVYLFLGGNLVATARTNTNGSYTLTDVLSREGYKIEASLNEQYTTEKIDSFDMPRADVTGKDLVLERLWKVDFDSNGGSFVSPQYIKSGETVAKPDPYYLTKDGYTFENWYNSPALTSAYIFSTPVTEDITLYAKWIANTYTVVYISNGGFGTMPNQNFVFDVAQGLIANTFSPQTGYIFAGWARTSAGEVVYADQQNVSNLTTENNGTVTLYAQWNPITYTVDYDKNADDATGTMEKSTHTYDVDKTLTANAYKRTGHAFVGWARTSGGAVEYTDGQSISNLTTVNNATVTLYAKWAIAYTVTFNKNNTDDGSTEANPPTEDVLPPTTTVGTLPTPPTRPGYTHNGWNTQTDGTGTNFTASTTVTENITVYAQWTANTYTVVYNANGGSGTMESSSHTYGVSQALIANAYTRTGYTSAYWNTQPDGSGTSYSNSQSVSNLTTVNNGTVTLYAQWTGITYTVAYDANGGSGSMLNQNFTYGVSQNLRTNAFTPPAANQTFAGWARTSVGTVEYTDGQSVSNLTTVNNATVTLYAQWTARPQYTITFNINNGSGTTPASQTRYAGESITLPGQGDLVKTGYTFGGWSTNAAGTENNYTAGSSYTVNESRTLYAKWNLIQYTVTFISNGGSSVPDQTVNSGATATRPANPTRNGFTFDDWYSNSGLTTVYSFSTPVTGNTTLYAKWTAVTQYTVTFISNGGSSVPDQTVNSGATATRPANPTRNGFTFDDWYSNSGLTTVYSFSTPVNSNITLFAKWDMKPVITMNGKIELNGGTGKVVDVVVQLYRYNESSKTLEPVGSAKNPEADGHYTITGDVTAGFPYFIAFSLGGYATIVESVSIPGGIINLVLQQSSGERRVQSVEQMMMELLKGQ
jgi:uncharacterized repeat protein (TIGR02543 family)